MFSGSKKKAVGLLFAVTLLAGIAGMGTMLMTPTEAESGGSLTMVWTQ